jgi:hypothetical protein
MNIEEAFNAWWANTNNEAWFNTKPITVEALKETAFFSWRAAALADDVVRRLAEEANDLRQQLAASEASVRSVEAALRAPRQDPEPPPAGNPLTADLVEDLIAELRITRRALEEPCPPWPRPRYPYRGRPLPSWRGDGEKDAPR